jgi:hypothetical protein
MMHIIMAATDDALLAKAVKDNKATFIQMPRSLALAISTTDLAERYDLPSLIFFGARPLPFDETAMKAFLAKGEWQTTCMYGMTEGAAWAACQKLLLRIL